MYGFLIFALVFVGLLTLFVRLVRLGVRKDLPRGQQLALSGAFVGALVLAWWVVTRGARFEDRLVNVTILASPLEMLRAFVPLHVDQALVRNAFTSIGRIITGFCFAGLLALPLGVYMA